MDHTATWLQYVPLDLKMLKNAEVGTCNHTGVIISVFWKQKDAGVQLQRFFTKAMAIIVSSVKRAGWAKILPL